MLRAGIVVGSTIFFDGKGGFFLSIIFGDLDICFSLRRIVVDNCGRRVNPMKKGCKEIPLCREVIRKGLVGGERDNKSM